MFEFFNGQQNPFMSNPFMAMMGAADTGNEETEEKNADPMQFMQQLFAMQMQMAQNMMMMPLQMIQNITNMSGMPNMAGMPGMPDLAGMFKGFGMAEKEEKTNGQKEGFSLGGMNIPPELLKKLMQMDMTPENLEKLQKVLDFVFEAMPQTEDK